jgi:hypothetical protein
MSPVKLALVVAMTFATGCLFKGKPDPGSVSNSRPECKKEITQFYDARMPCIVEGPDNSTHVGDVFTFQCRPFDPKGGNIVIGSDPFTLSTPICPAAAYVDMLDAWEGGTVKIEILAKVTEFPQGEVKHGIKSRRSSSTRGTHAYRVVD